MSKNTKKQSVQLTADVKILLEIELKGEINRIRKTLSLNSSVDEIMADGCLLIHMPVHKGYYYSLPINTPITLYFSTKHRMYSMVIKVKEHIKRENLMYEKVVQISEAKPNQRRNCYRLPCSLPVMVERTLNSNNEQRQPAEGQMIDFSEGGMLFTTNEDISIGEKITLSFTLVQTESVEAEVLRSESAIEGDYKYIFAAQFVYKDNKKKERFFKYIIVKQRENIKKESEQKDTIVL